jgi:peptidoglycan/LPS O-acetylase OafA/YrhL
MRHIPALDGIRAIAIICVVAFHARVPGFGGGYLGVDVFFVLSGYLITCLLAQELTAHGRIDLPAFYRRRVERLYPAMLLMLGAYVLLAPLAFGDGPHLRDAALAGLYLSDYSYALWQAPTRVGHTWSLAVEAQFYLLWPWALLALWRLAPAHRALMILGLAMAAMLWRWHVWLEVDDWTQPYYRFDTRLSGLLLGGAVALWNRKLPSPVGWVALAGLAVAVMSSHWKTAQGIVTSPLLAELCAVALILSAERVHLLRSQALAWLGRISYGLYLWHYPIVLWMRHQGFEWPQILVLGGGAATALAALSYYSVEALFRARRRRRAAGVGAPQALERAPQAG